MKNRDKTGHLAWCALVALQQARHEGLIRSESQEDVFITRRFSLAREQRHFSCDVAADIDWILNQGRTLGVRARHKHKHKHKQEYICRSCSGELLERNDMFRLIRALELATHFGWVYHVLSDKEWLSPHLPHRQVSVNGISNGN